MVLCYIILPDDTFLSEGTSIDIFSLEEFDENFEQLEKQHQGPRRKVIVAIPSSTHILNIHSSIDNLPYTTLIYHNRPRKERYSRKDSEEFQTLESIGDEQDRSGEIVIFGNPDDEYKGKCLKRHLISKEQARRALRYFVQTGGQLTDEMGWENPFPWHKKYFPECQLKEGEEPPF
jgi:hypothetical protein